MQQFFEMQFASDVVRFPPVIWKIPEDQETGQDSILVFLFFGLGHFSFLFATFWSKNRSFAEFWS